MIPVTEPVSFGQENFGGARLRHKSRTRRLVQLADQVLQHPSGTWPERFQDPKQLQAFYRLMAHRTVTHASVLASHQALTRRRMALANDTILIVHDGSEYDYSGLRSLNDLGQLGNGHTRGFLGHNSLAVQASNRRVLGLLNQILYRRPRVPKGEKRAQTRARKDRESRLWQRACEEIGPAPSGQRHVDVCDRGADIFEYIEYECLNNRWFVVRATHDRAVTVDDPATLAVLGLETPFEGCLFELARMLPEWGRKEVEVAPRSGQSSRTAVVRLASAPVQVHAPENPVGDHGQASLLLWLVFVCEIDPPAGKEPVVWVLLTNVPVTTYADLEERVGWYETRWLAEEFHKAQKTGCSIEEMQLGKENHDERGKPPKKNRLEPAIALLSVVAVQLLCLHQASGNEATGDQPATEVFTQEEVAVLSAWRHGSSGPMTLRAFGMALGRLGGHLNRRGDGFPGWQTLWKGWKALQLMVQGARTVGSSPHDSPSLESKPIDSESG